MRNRSVVKPWKVFEIIEVIELHVNRILYKVELFVIDLLHDCNLMLFGHEHSVRWQSNQCNTVYVPYQCELLYINLKDKHKNLYLILFSFYHYVEHNKPLLFIISISSLSVSYWKVRWNCTSTSIIPGFSKQHSNNSEPYKFIWQSNFRKINR